MSSAPSTTTEPVDPSLGVGFSSPVPRVGVWKAAPQPCPLRHSARDRLAVAIIDDRALMRDCFGRSLTAVEPDLALTYHSSVDEFVEAAVDENMQAGVVLICVVWSNACADLLLSQIAGLRASRPDMAVVVLSDIDDPGDMARVLECGGSGYIPTSVSLEVAAKAIQLVAAGGMYIPADILFRSTLAIDAIPQRPRTVPDKALTSRQTAVVEALRQGKPNKIIAYELNMCESTVKVHIRNIMKKLKARNRTEVAYILSTAASGDCPAVRN